MERWQKALGTLALLAVMTGTRGAEADNEFTCPPSPASHNDREKLARQLFEEATHREAADPESALARFRCAATLADRPAVHLRIGVVAERLQQYDEAIAGYERYLELAGKDAPDAVEMRTHIQGLERRRDEAAAPHEAPAPAPAPELRTPPPPPPPPRPESPTRTILGWSLVGLGAAVGIGGGLLMLDAKAKNDDVHALPTNTPWASDEAKGAFDAAKTEQTIGIALLVAAPILVVGGVIVQLTGRSQSSPRNAMLAPNAARLTF